MHKHFFSKMCTYMYEHPRARMHISHGMQLTPSAQEPHSHRGRQQCDCGQVLPYGAVCPRYRLQCGYVTACRRHWHSRCIEGCAMLPCAFPVVRQRQRKQRCWWKGWTPKQARDTESTKTRGLTHEIAGGWGEGGRGRLHRGLPNDGKLQ